MENYKAPRSDYILPIIFIVVLTVFVAGVMLYWDQNKPTAHAIEGVRYDPAVALVLNTNTPEPSETPKETHTPYPTFTQIIPSATNNVVIEKQFVYVTEPVEVTRLVTYVVEKVITNTPQPATAEPTPTHNATSTQVAIMAGIDNTKAKQNLWLRGLGIAGLWFLFIMGAIIVIIATWNKVKPKYPAVEQTADEILEMSPVPGVTMEEFDQIRLMKAQGKSQTAIEWLISGNRGRNYTGGTVHRHVKAVLEYLEQTTSPPMDDEYLTGATQA